MALREMVALAAAEFESGDLFTLVLLHDLGHDACACNDWSTNNETVAFAMSEHLVKGSPFAFCDFQFFDVELVAHGHFILLAAGFKDCVCHNELKRRGESVNPVFGSEVVPATGAGRLPQELASGKGKVEVLRGPPRNPSALWDCRRGSPHAMLREYEDDCIFFDDVLSPGNRKAGGRAHA
jgi:hypothetical protein